MITNFQSPNQQMGIIPKKNNKITVFFFLFFLNFHQLRRYAANDKTFKLFFLHPFLASTIYNNTIKNKFDIG